MKTFKFRLYPKKSQITLIKQQLEVHRKLYNQCLDKKKRVYETDKTNITCFDLIKSEIPSLKGQSNYSAMQNTVRRLDKAYSSFFKKNGNFPRFKGKDRFNTIEFSKYGDGCKLKGNQLYIQYVGNIYINFHREIPSDYKIKTLSITLRKNRVFVSVITDRQYGFATEGNKTVGIDFGIKTTITTSDSQKFISPYFYKRKQKDIAKLQRKKKYKALFKVYTKVANIRKDFNHKLSRTIVNNYDIICLENLKVNDILSYNDINRKLYDIGINQLIQFISYKAESAGKKLVLVDPAYTTQTCSKCGIVQKKELNERVHLCQCGYSDCRDINAAKNIRRLGLQSLDLF